MSVPGAITVMFWITVAVFLAGLVRRARLWFLGQAAHIRWLGLVAVPKRYFVDLHHIVARDLFIARTHVATAGGAVAVLGLMALNYGFALYAPLIERMIVAAAALMLAGTYFVWARRRKRPARLSAGAWDRLPISLAAFAAGVGILALVSPTSLSALIAVAALFLLAAGSAEFALGIGTGGPMKHAVAGLLNLAFHPRPERFSGSRSTALKPIALDARDFGVSTPADFKWNELLNFDACVQCGRCEAMCPAFAAGQPLNPKKLVQDLVCGFSGTGDGNYAGSPHPGQPLGTHYGSIQSEIVPQLIENSTLWACTTCRACVEECPMFVEHVDAVVSLRRHLNLVHGEAPGKAAEALANLRETGTLGGYDTKQRYNWAADLNVKHAEPGLAVDVLLIAGDGAYDMRYQRTLRALVKVLQAANVDFAVLGALERDTGDTARRLGDEATFQKLAHANIATLKSLTFGRIVTPDPHVLHALRNEYSAFGGHFDVIHHTTFLERLLQDRRLAISERGPRRRLTYHDPCYLGRYNGEFDAPRTLLTRIGFDIKEMERSGPRSRCCGGGGGASITDIPGKARIPDMRIADARATETSIVAVACPQCTAMLEGVSSDRPDVLDVAELVASALETRT